MKCNNCQQIPSSICLSCFNQSQKAKLNQIKDLTYQIIQSKHQVNTILQSKFLQTQQQRSYKQNSGIKYSDNKQNFQKEICELLKKQKSMTQINVLKRQIAKRQTLLKQRKQKRQQQNNKIKQLKQHAQSLNQRGKQSNQKKLHQLKQSLQLKQTSLIQSTHIIRSYLSQLITNILTVYKIHQNFLTFQKRTLFKIKQVQQLDFTTYNKQDDPMLNSVYQLQNVQQVYRKQKTNEKGIHVIFQNVIILAILQKIFNLWLPYPIECRVSFNQSKLLSKLEDVRICGRKLIDYSMCVKLSKNIIQFFPSKLNAHSKNNQKNQPLLKQQQQEDFKYFQINQNAQYNKRRIQLDKLFVNCLQVNLEYISLKNGIYERPLVFCDRSLVKIMSKKFKHEKMYRGLQNHKSVQKAIILQRNKQQYRSMLKQVKISNLLQLLLQNDKSNIQQEQQNKFQFKKSISQQEEQCEQQQQQQQVHKNEQTKINHQSFCQPQPNHNNHHQQSMDQIVDPSQLSLQQIVLPQQLYNIKSSQTDNDEFQLLSQIIGNQQQ